MVPSIQGFDDDSTQADDGSFLEQGDGPWVFAGRYEIHALLGVGGMGSVYKALDRELDDIIALKVIRKELLRVPGVVERFRREVKLSRKVTHKNVARVYDLGESDGERYFTMEYVDGTSLGTTLCDGVPPLALALRMGRQISEGLAAAHAAGVIHRDLKPDNVILGSNDRAVITDFGIARTLAGQSGRTTLDGTWIGTPVYMAPELIEGNTVADESCDVFALGAVLFEAVTRELPWTGETDVAIAIERLSRPPRDPRELRKGLPDAFAEIILRCLARDRTKRFATAQAVGRALELVVLPTTSSFPGSMPPRNQLDTLPAFSIQQLPFSLAPSVSGSTKAVAVLPFRQLGGADEYLTDGLTETVIDALSANRHLRVRPRGMVMAHRQSELPAADLGVKLGVQVVAEGTVERRAEKLFVVVRITSVATRFRIWAGHFERELSELALLGEEIAAAVSDSLALERRSSRRRQERDPRVADLYLRARHAYHAVLHDGSTKAVALFERALEIAPDDPGVLAGYALACLRESAFSGVGFEKAATAAARARALGPEVAEARVALAAVKLHRGDSVGAVHELKPALAADASFGEAHALLGRILLEADVVDTGKKRLEWALAIEPDQNIARRDLARAHALVGNWEGVERIAASEPRENDAGAWLDRARFTLWRKNGDAAALYLDALRARYQTRLDTSRGPIGLARALFRCASLGTSPFEDEAFIDFLGAGRGTARRSSFVSQIEAEVYAALGKRDEALEAIVLATEAGLVDLAWLDRCPLFESLKGEAAFETARSRVGAIAASVREAVFDD